MAAKRDRFLENLIDRTNLALTSKDVQDWTIFGGEWMDWFYFYLYFIQSYFLLIPSNEIYPNNQQNTMRVRAYTFTSVMILYFTINGYAQEPICNNYENFWKGESCFYNDQKDSAIIYYSKAYNNSRFGNVANCLNTISKAVECDSFDFAKKLLKVSLIKGLLDTSYYAKYFKEHPEMGLSTIFYFKITFIPTS